MNSTSRFCFALFRFLFCHLNHLSPPHPASSIKANGGRAEELINILWQRCQRQNRTPHPQTDTNSRGKHRTSVSRCESYRYLMSAAHFRIGTVDLTSQRRAAFKWFQCNLHYKKQEGKPTPGWYDASLHIITILKRSWLINMQPVVKRMQDLQNIKPLKANLYD